MPCAPSAPLLVDTDPSVVDRSLKSLEKSGFFPKPTESIDDLILHAMLNPYQLNNNLPPGCPPQCQRQPLRVDALVP
jgi:hypothetical protein